MGGVGKRGEFFFFGKGEKSNHVIKVNVIISMLPQ
jgi:hypothetical protein